MTNKKQRNVWAKQITRSLSFVMRHRIAKKMAQQYTHFNFAYTTVRNLKDAGFEVYRPNKNIIVLDGKAFQIFQWKDYGNRFTEDTIDLTQSGEDMYGVADNWGSVFHGTYGQCLEYVQENWSDDFPMEVFRDYCWD